MVGDGELDELHAEAFEHELQRIAWNDRLTRHSLGWVTARTDRHLVGFVNVIWDGGAHAFLLDTAVADRARSRATGTLLVAEAAEGARAAGCRWLHVDFEAHLTPFYLGACGFHTTSAGLLGLQQRTQVSR